MESSLLTLLIAVVIVTFALGFIFARLAKLARMSTTAPQFATEGASASMPAVPEPVDVLTQTQLHYQQTHINGLNTQVRMLEEKLRWVEQDRRDAEDAMIELQQQLKAAQSPRGDEVTQREAEIALLRAQLNAAISNASKMERKLIRAESDAQSAQQENQELRAKIWAQQSTDVALNRLQDRQAALQAAILENQNTRDRLAGEVVALSAALAARESLLAEREATLETTQRRLNELQADYARLAARENEWEKQCAVLADMQGAAAQAHVERNAAQEQIVLLHLQFNNASEQLIAVQERLHAMHEAMALRDGQVTELHGELRRLQLELAFKQDAIEQAKAALHDLRNDLAHTVTTAEETRTLLRLRESAVASLQGELAQAKAQQDTLEAALVLATSNLEALREQFNDAEAGRMLLEAELQHKTEALALANEDLGQLSSREYELTVALERSGREHQSSLETALVHMNRLEEDLKQAQTAFATKEDETCQLAQRLQQAEAQVQAAEQELSQRDAQIATLQAQWQDAINALENRNAVLLAAQKEAGELAERLQQAEAQVQAAEEELSQRGAQIATLQAQLQDAIDALENRNVVLLAAQKEAGELAEEVKTLAMTRASLETHLQAKVAVLATAEAMIASMKTSLAEREQQLADLRILAKERGRELESAHAQITHLISGMDDLSNTANEKYVALQEAQHAWNEAQTALDRAEGRIGQLIAEQDLLKSELAGALQHNEALAGENSSLHSELASMLQNTVAIQSQLDASQAQIERMQFEAMAVLAANQLQRDDLHQMLAEREEKLASLEIALTALQTERDELTASKADADRIIGAQAGEIAALVIARSDAENALKLAEARMDELEQALKAAVDQQATLKSQFAARSDELETLLKTNRDALTDAQSELEWLRIAHSNLQLEHESLEAAKSAADEILEAQAGEIDALASLRRQNESALAQAESRVAQLTSDLEKAIAGHAVIEAMLKDSTEQQSRTQLQLDDLRQAHAALLMEHDALQKMRAALEMQTHNQMETLVEMSNAAAAMQKEIQARESALQATQNALAEAQQVIARKPEPGTLEARLIDTTLTLQRLEKDYAALQAEKDAIEDEYTREQIAGHVRVQEKEAELRECGAQVDALELEIALLKTQQSK